MEQTTKRNLDASYAQGRDMDAFRLLTRSTGLQKKNSAGHRDTKVQVPSEGHPAHGDNPSDLESRIRAGRGIKRKHQELEQRADELPDSLNYFAKTKQDRGSLQNICEPGKDAPHIEPSTATREDQPVFTNTRLTEEECKQVYKRHKLKVTALTYQEASGHERSKPQPKIAGTEKQSKKKDGHRQLWPQPMLSFKELRQKYGLSRRLAENIAVQGYKEPTEVQLGAIPLLLGTDRDRGLAVPKANKDDRKRRSAIDLLTVAPTGSGKTLAFLIPILKALADERSVSLEKSGSRHVKAIIVAPTHELVTQIAHEAKKLALGTGIKVSGLQKGMKIHTSKQEFELGSDEANGGQDSTSDFGTVVKADVVIGTPLMIVHSMTPSLSAKPVALPSVQWLVLDEADLLLDSLFRDQTLDVWSACSNSRLQTSLWSATIGSSIETVAQDFLLDRRRRNPSADDPVSNAPHPILRLVVGLKDSAVSVVTHHLTYVASEQGKLLALRQIIHPSITASDGRQPNLQPPYLIFTQTISRAVALHSELLYDIAPEAGGSSRIAVLHSDLSDTARSNIMAGLRNGEIWIVITTDLLARGVDIRGLNGVVNYDIPNTGAVYVHRIGRTGRQGREGGVAVTLYTKDDIPYVKNIANVIAASEKARALSTNGKHQEGGGVQKWLLDALPDLSKNTKKALKQRGVESRRVNPKDQDGRQTKKMRISTKSGHERRMEDRRKGAIEKRRRMAMAGVSNDHKDSDSEEWAGIDA